MDRFIETILLSSSHPLWSLKSNMDRFIVENIQIPFVLQMRLKSNMDRFIG